MEDWLGGRNQRYHQHKESANENQIRLVSTRVGNSATYQERN